MTGWPLKQASRRKKLIPSKRVWHPSKRLRPFVPKTCEDVSVGSLKSMVVLLLLLLMMMMMMMMFFYDYDYDII